MNPLRLFPGPQPIIVRYGATILLVLLSFGLKLGLRGGTGPYAFILYIPAVVTTALVFDRASGFLAVAVASVLVAATVPWTAEKAGDHIAAISSFIIIAGLIALLSEGFRKALERADAATAAQKTLLEEMNHRVKNKFAMISSIIALQARSASPDTRVALEAVASRVKVMAQVHEYLQVSRQSSGVAMDEYLAKLCASLADALSHLRPISVVVAVEPVDLAPDRALSVGLIVNELVTNAFKYAFPDERAGTIRVGFVRESGDVVLTVQDDGVGRNDDTQLGLGTRLVESLAAQVGGTCQRRNDQGLAVVITFPLRQLRRS
jgi:two-component sensor histidine kinase